MFEKLQTSQIKNFDVKSQLSRWIYELAMHAAKEGEQARQNIATVDALKQRQQAIREGIVRCIGGIHRSDTPLLPEMTGIVQGDGFRIEKVLFQSRPDVYVTGNLYLPDHITAPRGAVLMLSGHREQAKHHNEYQTVCHYLVKAGLIVFSIDPVGQGERFGYYDPATKHAPLTSVLEHENVGRQCLPLGDSLARYMLHDAVRAIDYLCTRPEVDPERIGVTGHSGGGTQTALVMMYDERIAAAAPGGFIMNRPYFLMTGKPQDAEQKWPGFSALGFDHEDIIMAMSPRPVMIMATTYCGVPIEGARHTYNVNRRFWELCGQSEQLRLYEEVNVHRYSPTMAQAAAQFFASHLLGVDECSTDDEINLISPEELLCTKSGQVLGEIKGAKSISDENLLRLHELERARKLTEEQARKQRAIDWLRQKVYYNREPVDFNTRPQSAGLLEHESIRFKRFVWWSQRGLLNHGIWFEDSRTDDTMDEKRQAVIAIWDGGTAELAKHAHWIRSTCAAGRLAIVLDPTGIGPLLPHLYPPTDNPFKKFGLIDRITDELMWLNDSMAALRTYDVLRSVEWALSMPMIDPSNVQLYGHGRYSVYASWAALLDERINAVTIEDRFSSFAEWISEPFYDDHDSLSFIIPGILHYFDLPDADCWLTEEGRFKLE